MVQLQLPVVRNMSKSDQVKSRSHLCNPIPSPGTVAAPAMAVEDQRLIADAQNEELSTQGWRRASGPLVLGLLGSNLLSLAGSVG